jgi:hypothetical protein
MVKDNKGKEAMENGDSSFESIEEMDKKSSAGSVMR